METKRLIEHLGKEAELYKEFIGLLQRETEHLIHRDYKNIYETAGMKEHMLARLAGLGTVRTELMRAAASSLGARGDVNLTAIISLLGPPMREELLALQKSILSLIESVKEINKVNSLVVKDSLENINKTLGFLRGFAQNQGYRPTGAVSEVSLKGTQLSEGA